MLIISNCVSCLFTRLSLTVWWWWWGCVGMAHVPPTVNRPLQVPVTFPAECRTHQTYPTLVQGTWLHLATLQSSAFPCTTSIDRLSLSLSLQGTLRVLLVLLHDFPEFLCDYHFSFCDVIPPNCIQMRNLILSAFPRNMRLPDPFTPNLKVKRGSFNILILVTRVLVLLAGGTAARYSARSQDSAVICSAHQRLIKESMFGIIYILVRMFHEMWCGLIQDLDNYIKSRAPVTFLAELRGHLQVDHSLLPLCSSMYTFFSIRSPSISLRYRTSQASSIMSRWWMLWCYTWALSPLPSSTVRVGPPHPPPLLTQPTWTYSSTWWWIWTLKVKGSPTAFVYLSCFPRLPFPGRYLFLNAIANQLRYPNSHTHYFSCALLSLFSETNHEAIQEQITRWTAQFPVGAIFLLLYIYYFQNFRFF